MTKLLLNVDLVTLHNAAGVAIPPGGCVLDTEMGEGVEAIIEDGALVHVKPSDLPEDLSDASLSEAALEHVWRGRNADAPSGDDASVKANPKGGKS
jgi:hypothetical protein